MYRGGEIDRQVSDTWTPPGRLTATGAPVDRETAGYTEVNGLWVPTGALRDDDDVARGRRSHPRGIGYRLDALTRARILAGRHPDWVLSGWSAAGVWGLPWFCDDADTCAVAPVTPRLARDAADCTVRRRTPALAGVATVAVDPLCPSLRITPPVLTVIHCLQSVWRGDHRWDVPGGTGLSDRGLRAVQTVDALCTLFGVAPAALQEACRDQFRAAVLRRILAVADQGTDSPMETVMRLKVSGILRTLVDRGALADLPDLTAQLVVHADGTTSDPVHTGITGAGRIVARLDLGMGSLRLGLQYDGSGHLMKEQRDRDSLVTAELANLDWHTLRLTFGHLTDDGLLWKTVTDGIRLCLSRL
jgi:hypothetical protein